MRKTVLIALLAIPLLITPFSAYAEVYKWVDEKGDVHLTDDYSTIPEEYRHRSERKSLSEDSKSITEGAKKEKADARPVEQKKTEVKQEETPSGNPIAQEMPSIFSGKIIKIDNVERMLTVEGNGETIEFTVSENTKIATDFGKNVVFTELWRGMLVTVEYFKRDNAIYPVKIKINTAGLYRR